MIPMYDSPISERLWFLLKQKGITAEQFVEGMAGKLSKSYAYYLLSGERDNLSQDKVEALAAFFDVSPLFFSRDPRSWLPPVPRHTIQYALRCTGTLDERSQHILDQLLARAYELSAAEEEQEKKQSK